ncbi:MAG: hypothetical protein DRN28_06110 [Thermoplasmata archaeon]|nr:MAG: hypothetical protein DRN28_06110 [Thermoplasmata archaeon]
MVGNKVKFWNLCVISAVVLWGFGLGGVLGEDDAEVEYTGRVLREDTGEPLAGVEVNFKNVDTDEVVTKFTNSNGYFFFSTAEFQLGYQNRRDTLYIYIDDFTLEGVDFSGVSFIIDDDYHVSNAVGAGDLGNVYVFPKNQQITGDEFIDLSDMKIIINSWNQTSVYWAKKYVSFGADIGSLNRANKNNQFSPRLGLMFKDIAIGYGVTCRVNFNLLTYTGGKYHRTSTHPFFPPTNRWLKQDLCYANKIYTPPYDSEYDSTIPNVYTGHWVTAFPNTNSTYAYHVYTTFGYVNYVSSIS